MERTVCRAQALWAAVELAVMQGDHVTASLQLEEGLAIATEQGSKSLIVGVLTCLSWIAHAQHNHAQAVAFLEDALAISRELNDKGRIADSLIFLGNYARDKQDYARARSLYEEGLALFQEVGDDWNTADALAHLGLLAQTQGEPREAWTLFTESLARWRRLGTLQWKGIADCLEGLAEICASQQYATEAARLFGAAETLRSLLGAATLPTSRASAEKKLADLHLQLDLALFITAWAEGRTLTPEEAVDHALALPNLSTSKPGPWVTRASTNPADLTAREVEVLRLLAEGLTYVQIADTLIISRRTVNAHVSSIYSKLAVNSRAAATRFAIAHHLV